jgi:hypothetical protein
LRAAAAILKSGGTMLKTGLALCGLAALVACTTAPAIYDPKDGPGEPASGSVRPLTELLPLPGGTLHLVFVHGVGDHCSGYALDPDKGWLNKAAMQRMGLKPITGMSPPELINVSTFMGGAPDPRSRVEFSTATYSMRLPMVDRDVPVTAAEITWSPLTQWIKSNQLGYDSPSTTPGPGAKPDGCTEPQDAGIAPTKPPPPRLFLDELIKEHVFDRNLSDAILYSGSYGATMERGVAEALCRVFTGTSGDAKCAWAMKPSRDAQADRYCFVTHSLGSRVVYDVFLNLLGYSTDAKPNPFSRDEIQQAAPAVAQILAGTQAFYMMANQLSLLGLANVPKDARSGSALHPFLPQFRATDVVEGAAPAEPGMPAKTYGNVFQALGAARASAKARHAPGNVARLQIVAFNDTNDLLTWHVPPWYANSDDNSPDRPLVDIANVFVQNAAKLVVIELPPEAHGGYFRNGDVWRVIACGGASGEALQCQ